MKKRIIVPICFVLIAIIGLTLFKNLPITKYTELAQRIALYHNKGNVNVSLDGKDIDMNGVQISYGSFETNKYFPITTDYFIADSFSFSEGDYGANVMKFTLEKEKCGTPEDVTVIFGSYNADSWWVNEYNIIIALENQNGVCTAKCHIDNIICGERCIADKTVVLKNKAKIDLLNDLLYYT